MTIALSGCKSGEREDSAIIGKANLTVTDGHFTPEIMHQLGKVSDPQISPDGTTILYGVTYTSIEKNRGNRDLFVMNIDGSNNTQITQTSKSESNARWINGGRQIAFLYSGQIFVMNPDGSKRHKIGTAPEGILEFSFSPDESNILYSSPIKVNKTPSDIYPDLSKAEARTYDQLMYRHWDHFVETIPHSYIAPFDGKSMGTGIDILDGQPFELPTEPFGGLDQLSWSPSSKFIAYSCRKLTGVEYAFSTNTDIYFYDIAGRTCENLSEGMPGYDTDPVFSPDGKYVAWLSMARGGYEADKVRLFIIDMESRQRTELTGIGDCFRYNVESPAWSPDSKEIYFASLVEGVKELWKTDLNGKFTRVSKEHEWTDYSAPQLLCDAENKPVSIITTNTTMMRPSEIVSVSLADGSCTQLTFENKHILDQIPESRMEERWIPTTDGKKMLTWVVYPPQFDSTKVYPAILLCLGGPQGTLSQGWSYRWNYKLMAAQDYIVVLPNRRGTNAFGQEWCEQISGDYIGQNMKDYFSAADALKAEPYVGKMAAVGASYGGYSVYYLAGIHQKRFSAFIAHAGIFNQEHMFMETEEMWFPNWDNGGVAQPDIPQSGAPWSDNPVAKRHYDNSPHKLVKNWDTPILVTHGELDYRVPVDQGMAAFNAAQMMGVPSKLVLFPGENHWILKPQNSIYWNRVFFEWLDKWCKK